MRGNKYKISKKRRLRRRGKYSKKLKPKSRKSGGRFPSFLWGHEKSKVTITATCAIPEFFFKSHNLFCELMSIPTPVEQPKYPRAHIDISVYGDLLEKNKTAGDSYTLSVKLDSDATIDNVYFSENMQTGSGSIKEKKLDIAAPDSRTFNVKFLRKYSAGNDGKGMRYPIPIQYSEYTATEPEDFFVVHDTDDHHILKALLHLWRINYTDPRVETFDVFFSEFSTKYPDILKLFREHTYNFQVVMIRLSSS
jgi:hypothetical protein